MGDPDVERIVSLVRESYNSATADLKKKLTEKTSEVQTLKKKIADAKTEKNALKQETDATARRLRAERAEAREQTRKKDLELQQALKNAKTDPQVKVLQTRVDNLTKEKGVLKKRITDLETRNHILERQLEEVRRTALAKAEARKADFEERAQDEQDDIDELQAALNPAAAAGPADLQCACGICSLVCVCALDTQEKRDLMRQRPLTPLIPEINKMLYVDELRALLRRGQLIDPDKVTYEEQRRKNTLIASLARYIDRETEAAEAAQAAGPTP